MMKKLGENFKTYKRLEIEHIGIPDTGNKHEAKFYTTYGLNKALLTELRPSFQPYVSKTAGKELYALRVMRSNEIPSTLEAELNEVNIGVAPAANVYPIQADQQNLAESIKRTLSTFNYYIVELGLNVMLGRRFKISELLFEVDLMCDGRDRTDVTAYDIAPDDTIKHTKIVDGKISLGITKLLKFVPNPIGEVVSNLLSIEINPWEFKWGFDRYMIDANGKQDYHIHWKIYETNVVQGFNPTIILKARKDVNTIFANVRTIYKLMSGWPTPPEIRSKGREIKIWPM